MSLRSLKTKSAGALILVLLMLLSACGTSGNSPSSNTGSGSTPKGNLVVGGKLDVESQLLTKMYTLLLQKANYKVTEKPALGNSNIVFQAITSGSIDIYPEFTATGLNKLQVPTTYDPQKDYQAVKDGFDKNYKLSWLDAAPLNDGYALCTSKETSQKLGITSISDVKAKASQLALTSPSDGVSFVDGLQKVYGLTTKSFKSTQTVDYALGFDAVKSDKAQITVCYGTDATVPQGGFVFLKDDKNGFPAFNPAPVVRNDIAQKYPDIASVLNPLAPKLTTDVSIQLQTQVAQKKSDGASVSRAVTLVATDFLKRQGLL